MNYELWVINYSIYFYNIIIINIDIPMCPLFPSVYPPTHPPTRSPKAIIDIRNSTCPNVRLLLAVCWSGSQGVFMRAIIYYLCKTIILEIRCLQILQIEFSEKCCILSLSLEMLGFRILGNLITSGGSCYEGRR